MLRLVQLIGVGLLAFAGIAGAQLRDCVNVACTIVTDPLQASERTPVGCRLFDAGALLAESPLVGGGCRFDIILPSGARSLTARAFDALGESPDSNVVALRSVALGPPVGGSFT